MALLFLIAYAILFVGTITKSVAIGWLLLISEILLLLFLKKQEKEGRFQILESVHILKRWKSQQMISL